VSPDRVDSTAGRLVARTVDGLLEATIFGSFSRVGIVARRHLWAWGEPPRIDGRLLVVTGASSGIGRAAAIALARLGADVHLIGRDRERLESTRRSALATRGGGRVEITALDLVDAGAVCDWAARFRDTTSHLDGLVHGAGALFPDFRTAGDGTELTLATHVVAPFRLSRLLFPLLRHAASSVIVTLSSGGMYTQPFDLDHLELTAADYRGVTAYARAKRAQVVLAHEWARRWSDDGVASYAMHPGWVDTPGLTSGLPSFARLGPLLRTAEQGADTVVWLAADGPRRRAASTGSGSGKPDGVWLDRRRRSEYYLPTTYRRPDDRRHEGDALWAWCTARTASDVCSLPP
jgi:dehydrogenase/reductase SDR family member 12